MSASSRGGRMRGDEEEEDEEGLAVRVTGVRQRTSGSVSVQLLPPSSVQGAQDSGNSGGSGLRGPSKRQTCSGLGGAEGSQDSGTLA